MFKFSKLFLRTVTGLVLFGFVTIGLKAASQVITKGSTKTVAEWSSQGYKLVVGEVPVNANDRMTTMGVHEDGYQYRCDLYRDGNLVSTYTLRREKGFRATDIDVQQMQLVRNTRIMIDVELRPGDGTSLAADCMITPPSPDDKYSAGIVEWRTLHNTGV